MSFDGIGAPLARITGSHSFLTAQRQAGLEARFAARCARRFASLTVESGPFAGLRYPSGESHGSVLHPKLLGTYESELHPVLARLRAGSYDDIVDVGFAEGYYLVGLARWFPDARVWGFDPSTDAHLLCRALAQANAVAPGRLTLCGAATETSLAPALKRRALVVCDCEGCETGLFSAHHIERWRQSDLIIECHDFIEPGVTTAISERLALTHEVELVPAVDSWTKVSLLPGSLHALFSPVELVRLVDEGRPSGQSWIVAVAKPASR